MPGIPGRATGAQTRTRRVCRSLVLHRVLHQNANNPCAPCTPQATKSPPSAHRAAPSSILFGFVISGSGVQIPPPAPKNQRVTARFAPVAHPKLTQDIRRPGDFRRWLRAPLLASASARGGLAQGQEQQLSPLPRLRNWMRKPPVGMQSESGSLGNCSGSKLLNRLKAGHEHCQYAAQTFDFGALDLSQIAIRAGKFGGPLLGCCNCGVRHPDGEW